MNYKLLVENWRRFVEQEENPVSEPDEEEKEAGFVDKSLDDEVADSDFMGPPVPDDYLPPPPTPQVDRALAEMARWGGRKEKDRTPGKESINKILEGYYKKVDSLGLLLPGTVNFWTNQNKQGIYPHWSAIFIQYCMQDNDRFIEMQINGAGAPRNGTSHHKYYASGRQNWHKLKEGTLDSPYDWIFFTIKEARKIGYVATPGDLSFLQMKSRPIQAAIDGAENYVKMGFKVPQATLADAGLHADIVTKRSTKLSSGASMRAIGGNVSNTAGLSRSPRYAFMSQRPEVKDKVRAAYNLPK